MIILFVNNHLLLSDQEPERQGRISGDGSDDTPPPRLAGGSAQKVALGLLVARDEKE